MTERVTRRYLEGQAARIAYLVMQRTDDDGHWTWTGRGCQTVIEGGPGWTAWAVTEETGRMTLGYGRTKGELSAVLEGVEVGLRLGGAK